MKMAPQPTPKGPVSKGEVVAKTRTPFIEAMAQSKGRGKVRSKSKGR